MFDNVTVTNIIKINDNVVDTRHITHIYAEVTSADEGHVSSLTSYSPSLIRDLWPEADYERYVFSHVADSSTVKHYFKAEGTDEAN